MRTICVLVTVVAVLLACEQAHADTWYTNGQESAVTYLGGAQSSVQANTGSFSELFPAGTTIRERRSFTAAALLPTLQAGESFSSFLYHVWVYDGGSSQSYRRSVRFSYNDGSLHESAYTSSPYSGIGAGWQELSYDITSIVNQRVGEGYTHLSRFGIQASSATDPYYVDDVWIEYSILAATNPPTITAHPQSQTKGVGETATFSVTATGTEPLAYQWQKNTANLSGETNTSYTTPTLVLADDGNQYRCVVANAYGSETSSVATLTVNTTLMLYSNGIESASLYGNGSQTNGEARSGTYSEIFTSGSFNSATINVNLPTLQPNQTFVNFSHSVWFLDNDDPDQIYRIGVYLYNPTTSDELSVFSTGYSGIGTGWNERSQDLTTYINQNYTNGYTRISKIYVRAYDSAGTYVNWYVDDVQISTQIYTPPPPPPLGTVITIK